MRENDFLKWIAENTPAHPRVPLNIGDDMAAVYVNAKSAGDFPVLLKIDQCLDRVHFDLRQHSAALAGRKAVNRCLSDCAGMACLPSAIMVSVALPKDGPGSSEVFAKELFLACRDAAAKFDCPLVGGDTALWDQRLAISVAAMGEQPLSSKFGGKHRSLLTRSGAKIGDTLFVSGALGGSILGRHLTFEPRIKLAQRLAEVLAATAPASLHALMDLSDGLAQDLPRMCAASRVGANVHAARLPIHEDAYQLSERDGIPAGLHALADGEDYELLMAVDPDAAPELVTVSRELKTPLTAIGTVTAPGELRLIDDSGQSHPWPKAGWEHRAE